MDRAWILSSTRWCSFSMYITPTVTSWSNGSPVRPSNSVCCPTVGRSAVVSAARMSVSLAPSNTGVAKCTPSRRPAA